MNTHIGAIKDDVSFTTTRYVATSGSDAGNNCTDELAPCLTVGHALSQANDGDMLSVAAGTYVEPGLVFDKALTLTGPGVIVQ